MNSRLVAVPLSLVRTPSYLFGAIRRGRDVETRKAMLRELSWSRATGQSEAEFLVALTEVDPANVMEAGLVLPEPGREQEWFDENRVRLTRMGMALGRARRSLASEGRAPPR